MSGSKALPAGSGARAVGLGIRFVDLYFHSLLAYFVISNVYYSYRYVFKYNAEQTSPTYSATPAAFQIPKYGIAALFIVLGILVVLLLKPRRVHRSAVLVFAAGAYFLLSALLNRELADAAFLKMYALAVLPVLPLPFFSLEASHIAAFRKCVAALCAYHLAYSAAQLALFFTVGRLPALGYADSIMVRFGGGLDDPNAFAPMAFCMCIYLYDRIAYAGAGRARTLSFLYASLLYLFTMSFTSFVLAPALLAVYAVLRPKARPALILGFLAAGAIFLVLALLTPLLDVIELLLKMKQGSVEEHFSFGAQDFLDFPALHWVFGNIGQFPLRFFESDAVYLFFRYGLAGLLLLAGIALGGAWGYLRALGAASSDARASFLIAAALYLLAFAAGTWNLPYFRIHPINLNFWALAILGLSQRRAILEWYQHGKQG